MNAEREPIAIVGMSCRYPGAPDLAAFWRVLRDGVDTVTGVPLDRWDADALYDADPAARAKSTSRRGGFVDNLDVFDAAFFGISPREAPHIDPRQRLILECSWEALEAAGIPPASLAGSRTGVFVATLSNDYEQLLFADLHRVEAWSGAGTATSIVANRVSYMLDLHGPSMAIDTACSGSLVAIHLACQSLRRGESTLAIAGGVSVNLMPRANVFFSRAGALSPRGACRTFDRDADGIVRGDGAGVLVLKPLSLALADRDPIVAVIAGSAVNHDGRSNGIMAPNGDAQRAVLIEAYRDAGIAPGSVQYIEAHGTGTRLGDPIEVQALGSVVGAGAQRCVLGSLKTNFGHTESAAGVAGVIKTALAMQHRLLPATLHFREPNPLLGLDRLPFEVRSEAGPWPRDGAPLIAGVSGFGFGGTNAHVVLREAPPRAGSVAAGPPYLLPISARTPAALREAIAAMSAALDEPALGPGDACLTAATGRMHHDVRIAVAADSRESLRRELAVAKPAPRRNGRIAFVFSGQGSHWAEMGARLHAREPVYRAVYDRVAPPAGALEDTEVAQRSIFAVQVGLAALWRSWGIEPDIVVGHSLGEIAAAHVAGVLSLEEAARIVAHRSRLMKRAAGKGRTAVAALTLDEARALERPGISVAGSNSPRLTVLSGQPDAVATLARDLERRGISCRILDGIDIAFHSAQMDPLARELTERLADLRPAAATIPILSTVTGAQIDGSSLDAKYWGRNLREPFLFTLATRELLRHGAVTFVEVSPHPVLAAAIAQTAAAENAEVSILPSLRRGEDESLSMYRTLGALYAEGMDVRWPEAIRGGKRVALPTYPFQRQRYWFDQLDSDEPATLASSSSTTSGAHPLLGPRLDAADGAGAVYWERELAAQQPRWIDEHRVFGEPVLPGAAWLDMALTAARELDPVASLRDVSFDVQLRLRERRRVQVVASGGLLSLYSRGADDTSWTRHATARIGGTLDLVEPPRGAKERCTEPVDAAGQDDAMAAAGVVYGPAFRLIETARSGHGEAIATLALPPRLADTRHLIHPALLDSAFRVVAGALPSGAGYLPVGVSAFEVRGPMPERVTCHALVADSRDDLSVDVMLFDEQRVIATVRGLTLRRTAASRATALDASLLALEWEPRVLLDVSPRLERWRIEGDDPIASELRLALGDELGEAGVIVHFARDVEEALAAAQRAQACRARLVFVTRNAPASSDAALAAVLGLGAAVAVEEPELAVRVIDVDDATTALDLERELLFGGDEGRVLLRGGNRSVARIATATVPDVAVRIHADATYLLTGAFGALGQVVAESLLEGGARHLVLVSRRGAAGNEETVARLARGGAEIVPFAADVADADDVTRLFARIASMPPLRGVVHAAGVLHDALLADQSGETLREVFAPKALGAWNLHRATEAQPLDFFLLYASAASLLGSAGQANYAAANAALDALAHHRRARGLPALSIDWGAFRDGMAAEDALVRRFAARGVRTLDPRAAIDLSWRLAASDAAQLGVIAIDWPLFLQQFRGGVPPLFERFAAASENAAAQAPMRDRLAAATAVERRRLLFEHAHETLLAILGFDDATRVAPHQRFFDLGIDSLTAVELRNALQASLGHPLSSTLVFDHPTLQALTEHLAELLAVDGASETARDEFAQLSEHELAELLAQELGDGR